MTDRDYPWEPPLAGTDVERGVNGFLRARGMTEDEIREAEASGLLPLLVLDKLVFQGRPLYDESTLVRIVGVEPDFAQELWRAMGFPAVPDGEAAFYEDDLEALRGAVQPTDVSSEALVRQTRVMSAAMARIAEQSIDDVETTLTALRADGTSEREIAEFLIAVFETEQFERLLWYLFRRQFRAAAWRRLAKPALTGTATPTVVGFVDLVRFAAITEQVADDELERLIVRFEKVAHDAIADGGGRVVKMIGDAVMYVSEDPARAVAVALDLVDAYSNDDLLPPARAGLAIGNVLAREGDYFGPVVNLAARIVDVARPSRVVISDELHLALESSDKLTWHRLPPKRLKGIGHPRLWAVARQ